MPFALLCCACRFAVTACAAIILTSAPALSSTLWNWEYAGSGSIANGTLTTVDNPDGSGGYLVTAIAGTRNGETITGLQPAGTSIPGNQPYTVDNVVFLGSGPQLTVHGLGFSTSGGNYSNLFYADFLPVPGYLEFFSYPPFSGSDHTELPVQFSATPESVPEPATFALTLFAIVMAGSRWRSACAKFA
jgi:hypothetical protein